MTISSETQKEENKKAVTRENGERIARLGPVLWDRAPDGLLLTDPTGTIIEANPQLESLFGYDPGELTGLLLSTLIPERFRERHRTYEAKYYSDPVLRPMGMGKDLWGLRKNGTEFPVEISLSPVRDPKDGLMIFAAIRDFTERRRIEKVLAQKALELERSNADLEQFASVASHDLQEPLRTIRMHLQLLSKQAMGALGDDAKESLRFVVDAAGRMQELIQDLLAYARVGEGMEKPCLVNCNEVVEEVKRRLKDLIVKNEATIEVRDLPSVVTVPSQMLLLLQNLLGNAIKYRGNRSPVVTVEAVSLNGSWVFSVKDNGIGIEQESCDRIFQMFFRLHTKGEYPGTGIGLAICKKIVERQGGRIWVESKSGEGSTFFFTLSNRH